MRKKKSSLSRSLFLLGVIALFSNTAYADDNSESKFVFKMTQGQGTEVCEVYLQRLNATELLNTKTSLLVLSRVTEPLQKGFDDLKPVPLTAEEIQRIYLRIVSFTNYRDQDLIEKSMEPYKNDERGKWAIEELQKLPGRIENYMNDDGQIPFVRYQKKIDLDNDGTATDTLINNNYSLYIVDENLQRVDEAKMMAIFADQELVEWPTIAQFPPLAMTTNVFSYKGKYYFDGFLNLRFNNITFEFGVDEPPLSIGVFIHQQQRTQKACEYQLLKSPNKMWIPGVRHRYL